MIQIRHFKKIINSRFKFENNRMIRESIEILIDSEVNWQTLPTNVPEALTKLQLNG